MSECVLRMEFRKNCLDCDLHQIVYGDSYADTDVYCFKEKRLVGKRFGPVKDLARPSWCPIICSLPEGHWRLIDAEARVDEHILNSDGNVVSNIQHTVGGILGDYAELIPTVVPAERSEL